MLPATSTTEPNSPTARAKLIAAPERMAGTRLGSTMRRKIVSEPAPSDAAASSISRSSSLTTGCTERTTNGSVTKASASMIAHTVAIAWMPTGDVGTYSASRMIPTTIVGSANGRSMIVLMNPLPRKSSRTSTQAVSVPRTALNPAISSAVHRLSSSADSAWRLVTDDQNPPSPASVDRATNAASGIRTMTLSHSVASPRPSAPDPPVAARGRRRTRPAVRASLGSGDPRGLLDLGHRALVRVEELGVDLVPSAEVADGEQPGRRRELRGVLLEHRLVDRAVAPVGELLLGGRRQRVLDERVGLGGVLGLVDDGDRVLDQDRLVGGDVVDRLALLLGGDRLVLVGEEDVAVAGDEVLQRLAPRLVLDLDVLGDQLVEVVQAGLRVLAAVALGAVGGHQVPLRRARRERVGREHAEPGLEQVGPRVDVLRVALADDQRDDRLRDQALVGVVGPVLGHEAVADQAVHVGRQREGHDVGRQAVLDGAALVAGGAIGLGERDALAGVGLLEAGDDLVVDDLRRRVGDQRQLGRALARGGRRAAAGRVGRAAARGDGEGEQGGDGGEQRTGSQRDDLRDRSKAVLPIGLVDNSQVDQVGGQSMQQAPATVPPASAVSIARPCRSRPRASPTPSGPAWPPT